MELKYSSLVTNVGDIEGFLGVSSNAQSLFKRKAKRLDARQVHRRLSCAILSLVLTCGASISIKEAYAVVELAATQASEYQN